MADGEPIRRLTTIVAADVAGYSRLTASDEEATLAALRSHRTELIDPKIAEYRGRIANTAGDSLLIDFPSVVEALRCAIEIQRGMVQREHETPESKRVRYRIGINVGDVVEQNGDLLGDGVNVAARLEGLAEPDGICVSARVREDVRDKLDVGFQDIGEQALKNIARPVQVYRVLPNGVVAGAGSGARRKTFSVGRLMATATIVVLIAAGGGLLWWQPWIEQVEPAGSKKTVLALPDKPSIAVLPFHNMSGDPEQAYFADGMAEDIITDLSKISGLFVIARNSSFRYRGDNVAVKMVGRELGIKYVLEGSVRRAGDQVRVNAQLIDATTGGHIWAERYDGNLQDIFALQDRVANQIVKALALRLTADEKRQLVSRNLEFPEAYDRFLKGWNQYQRQTPESLREAITHFEKAVALDPSYARAYAALSATYWQIHKRFWHAKFGFQRVHDARFKAEEYLEKAKGRPTALSHQVAAAMMAQQGRHSEAVAEGGKAVEVDPNDADSYMAMAGALSLSGKPVEAQKLVRKAMRLNPHFPASYLYELGLAQFGNGSFDEAAVTLERAVALNPKDRWSSRLLLATYGHLGRSTDAERIFKPTEKNWIGNDPITVRAVAFWYPFKEAADRERLAAGLRKANVPD